MKIKKENEFKILVSLIVVLTLIDQISKFLMLKINREFVIIENAISLKLEQTLGIENNNLTYILISIIIIMAIARYMSNNNSFIKFNSKFILSFAISGAIGNLIDRIWYGDVIDFISVTNFASINLAYCYIFIAWIGVAVILTNYTKCRINERRKIKKKQ